MFFAETDCRCKRQNLPEKIISTYNAPYRFLSPCNSFMFILLILLNQIYLLSFTHAPTPVGVVYHSVLRRFLSSVQLALLSINEITEALWNASEIFLRWVENRYLVLHVNFWSYTGEGCISWLSVLYTVCTAWPYW